MIRLQLQLHAKPLPAGHCHTFVAVGDRRSAIGDRRTRPRAFLALARPRRNGSSRRDFVEFSTQREFLVPGQLDVIITT
jgi:hypothetical protein